MTINIKYVIISFVCFQFMTNHGLLSQHSNTCTTPQESLFPSKRSDAHIKHFNKEYKRIQWAQPTRSSASWDSTNILFVVTDDVAALSWYSIELMESIVDSMNVAFQNSGVPPKIRLCRVMVVNYNEDGDVGDTLDELQDDDDDIIDQVHTQRALWQADVVMMFVTYLDDGCGRADGISSDFGDVFSVVDLTCFSNKTPTHELGHNYECRHDENNDSPTYWGIHNGYGHPGGLFRTVMSYSDACGMNPCPRIYEFSGPNNYVTLPTGTYLCSSTTDGDDHNNIDAINDNQAEIRSHFGIPLNIIYGDFFIPTIYTINNKEILNWESIIALTFNGQNTGSEMVFKNGSKGSFKAENVVTLGPGFRSESGSVFEAYLCN